MTGFPALLQRPIIIFCAMNTFDGGISIPRLPLAIIIPSKAFNSSKFFTPSSFSIWKQQQSYRLILYVGIQAASKQTVSKLYHSVMMYTCSKSMINLGKDYAANKTVFNIPKHSTIESLKSKEFYTNFIIIWRHTQRGGREFSNYIHKHNVKRIWDRVQCSDSFHTEWWL